MTTNNKVKSHLTHWDKIFTTCTIDKGLMFLIYKEFSKVKEQMTENPIKMGKRCEQKIRKKEI